MPDLNVHETDLRTMLSAAHLIGLLGSTGSGKTFATKYILSKFTELGGRMIRVFCKDEAQKAQWSSAVPPAFISLHSVSDLDKVIKTRSKDVAQMRLEHKMKEDKKAEQDSTYICKDFKFKIQDLLVLVLDDPAAQSPKWLMGSDPGQTFITAARDKGIVRFVMYQDYTQILPHHRNQFNFILRFQAVSVDREKSFFKNFIRGVTEKQYYCIRDTVIGSTNAIQEMIESDKKKTKPDIREVGRNILVIKVTDLFINNSSVKRFSFIHVPPITPQYVTHPDIWRWADTHYYPEQKQQEMNDDPVCFVNSDNLDDIIQNINKTQQFVPLRDLPIPIHRLRGKHVVYDNGKKSRIRIAMKYK